MSAVAAGLITGCPCGRHAQQHRVRIAPQQPPAHQQRDLAAGPGAAVGAERAAGRPAVDRRDVGAAIGPVPEAAQRRAALVGREAAPQQLAVHLVVQADEQRFDEARVGLEQRDRVVRDLADAGQEALGRERGQVFVHRRVDLGCGEDAVERGRDHEAVVRAVQQRAAAGTELPGEPRRHRGARVAAREQRAARSDEIEADEAQHRWHRPELAARRERGDAGFEPLDRRQVDLRRRQRDRPATAVNSPVTATSADRGAADGSTPPFHRRFHRPFRRRCRS